MARGENGSNNKIFKILALIFGIALIVLIVVNCVIMYSKGKYTDSVEESYTANLEDFNVSFTLSYTDSSGNDKVVNASDLSSNHGVVRLTSEEYSTLVLNTSYTGQGKCYYRFKIVESWQHKEDGVDVITPKQLSTYTLSDNMYDNRSDDGYIYCKDLLEGDSSSITAISKFTEGLDAGNLTDNENHKSQFVDIAVVLEAVQWNQAEKVWDIEKLPWK